MKYHDITKCDMKNGDGLRAVLWVSGCGHHCPGCHNPVTWDPEDGLDFDDGAMRELMEAAAGPHMAGITLSGGDPLLPANRTEVRRIVEQFRQRFPGKTIWLYTGYRWSDICGIDWLPLVDVVVDGPFVQGLADARLMWKGSANQRVIDVQASLKEGSVVLHCGDYPESAPDGHMAPPACGIGS